MFEIGFGETVLVGVIALLVLGPERLPRVAREAGLWIRKTQSMFGEAKAEFRRELELDELRRSLDEESKGRIGHLDAESKGTSAQLPPTGSAAGEIHG